MRIEFVTPSVDEIVSFARSSRDGKQVVAGKNRSLAQVKTETPIAIYCKHVFDEKSVEGSFLQVISTDRQSEYQYLAPLTAQVKKLDQDGIMTPDTFHKVIERFLKENGQKLIWVKKMVVSDGSCNMKNFCSNCY